MVNPDPFRHPDPRTGKGQRAARAASRDAAAAAAKRLVLYDQVAQGAGATPDVTDVLRDGVEVALYLQRLFREGAELTPAGRN